MAWFFFLLFHNRFYWLRGRVHRHSNFYYTYPKRAIYCVHVPTLKSHILCSHTQTLKSHIVFMYANEELLHIVFVWTYYRDVPASHLASFPKTSHNQMLIILNPTNSQFYATQNILKISIFHSTLSQLLGKWTAMTTDITVLTGQGPRTGFLMKWFY